MIYVGNLASLTSGYTQAGLNHMASLAVSGFLDFCFFPMMGAIPWNTYPARFDVLRRGTVNVDRSVVVLHTLISELSTAIRRPHTRTVGMTALDADRCPRWCAVGVNRNLERLIVPSEHSRQAALKGGVTVPIHVAPHTISRTWWETPLPTVPKTDMYTFYYVGTWNARKNPEGVVRAYIRAWPDPGARQQQRLYLKLTQEDSHKALVEELVREETRAMGYAVADDWTRPDVVVATGRLSEQNLREIHAYGDCYVSATRGEAFGLAQLEAALLGRPVITTGWSAPTEFLKPEAGHTLVSYDLMPVRGMDAHTQFASDQFWADPHLDALSRAMRAMAILRTPCNPQALRDTYNWETQGPVFQAALGL